MTYDLFCWETNPCHKSVKWIQKSLVIPICLSCMLNKNIHLTKQSRKNIFKKPSRRTTKAQKEPKKTALAKQGEKKNTLKNCQNFQNFHNFQNCWVSSNCHASPIPSNLRPCVTSRSPEQLRQPDLHTGQHNRPQRRMHSQGRSKHTTGYPRSRSAAAGVVDNATVACTTVCTSGDKQLHVPPSHQPVNKSQRVLAEEHWHAHNTKG